MIYVSLSNIAYDDDLHFINNDETINIRVEGHALKADAEKAGKEFNARRGENIICAAVSHSALNLIRSLNIIGGLRPACTVEDGLIEMTLDLKDLGSENMRTVRVLIESFVIGMRDLEKKYKDFITIQTVTGTKR